MLSGPKPGQLSCVGVCSKKVPLAIIASDATIHSIGQDMKSYWPLCTVLRLEEKLVLLVFSEIAI